MRGRAHDASAPSLPFTGSLPITRATSHQAARAVSRAAEDRARILDHIRSEEDGGATDDEIQNALNMSGDSERPRRVELQRAGCIETRDHHQRATRSGRLAAVWYFVRDLPEVTP